MEPTLPASSLIVNGQSPVPLAPDAASPAPPATSPLLRPLPDALFGETVAALSSIYCPRRGFGPSRVPLSEVRDALGRGQGGRVALEVWSTLASHRRKKDGRWWKKSETVRAVLEVKHPKLKHVWDRVRRNLNTYVWPTRATIAREIADHFGVSRTDKQVEKALQRLYRVGLVRIVRSKTRRRAQDGSRYSELVVREIHGKMWLDHGRWVVGVPAEVAAAIQAAPRHGGNRWSLRTGRSSGTVHFQEGSPQPQKLTVSGPSSGVTEVLLSPSTGPGTGSLSSYEESNDRSAVVVYSKEEEVEVMEKEDDLDWLRREAGGSTTSDATLSPEGAPSLDDRGDDLAGRQRPVLSDFERVYRTLDRAGRCTDFQIELATGVAKRRVWEVLAELEEDGYALRYGDEWYVRQSRYAETIGRLESDLDCRVFEALSRKPGADLWWLDKEIGVDPALVRQALVRLERGGKVECLNSSRWMVATRGRRPGKATSTTEA